MKIQVVISKLKNICEILFQTFAKNTPEYSLVWKALIKELKVKNKI